MPESPKLSFKSEHNRQFEISAGSHLFVRDGDKEGVYWEWQKIPVLHDALNKILLQAEENLDRIKELLPDLPKNEIK